jgi:hypothetical protein
MNVATLDEKLIPILESATDRVEIQNKKGQVVGYFEPVQCDEYVRQSPYSIEEIREAQRNKGSGMSLAEALKKIGAQ